MNDISEILAVMPHRYPFLLIDRVLDMDEKTIRAVNNVTFNEPHFLGHFPGAPVMPGVLIVEAMAQAGGFLLFSQVEDREGKLIFFTGIVFFFPNKHMRDDILGGIKDLLCRNLALQTDGHAS